MDLRPFEEDFVLPEAIPLWRKAHEIRELVNHIVDAAPEPKPDAPSKTKDDELAEIGLQGQVLEMQSNALLITAKIVGAEGADLYDLRMEDAALIRKAARELIVGLRGLEIFGYDEQSYFNLLREEIEEFRKLFVEWVAAFDTSNYIMDDWGLFNPPGANPGDDIIGDLGYDDDDLFDDEHLFGPADTDPEDE